MDHVQSVAMAIALPMGAADDPDGLEGASAVAAEWCFRGAGERDTRALNDALDTLGCRHNERVRGEYLALSAGLLGKNLPAVLEIYADILRRPRWETAAFETCRMLVAQDLAALADEPSRQAMTLLTERFYPAPLGRCVYGTPAGLETLTAGSVREHASRRMAATGTVLALAGRFDWDAAVALVERLLGDWSGPQPAAPRVSEPPTGPAHLARPTAQTHIALAHRAPLMGQEHYYPFRVGEEILGGGMSGRLFTEVREKRGLVYGISTRYHTLRGHAGLMLYAGTRPEHAQETYDVTLGELRRIRDGIDEDELARARVQLRSSLVMQGESTLARAGALVSDWHLAGRLRTLEEIASAIEAVTREQVLEALTAYPPAEMTALVLGPDPIELGC
jgi:predicted Zn-dependent peptidase